MLRAAFAACLVAACSAPARPPAAPPAQPIGGLAALAGTWHARDVDGWTYDLTLTGDTFTQVIARTTGGPCTQKGTVMPFEQAYGSPYIPPAGGAGYGGATYGGAATTLALVVTLQENTCNPDWSGGAQLTTLASDYDGHEITLRFGVGSGGAQESHRYRRAAVTGG